MKCPLCQEELLEIDSYTWDSKTDYFCRNRVSFFDGLPTVPHYERRLNENMPAVEYWYIPPYQIILYPNKTIVEILPENTENFIGKYLSRSSFQYVFTINEPLQPDTPEKILKRIQLLTALS